MCAAWIRARPPGLPCHSQAALVPLPSHVNLVSVLPRHVQSGPEPGPPVEGAHLRIDVWPQEVDALGNLLGQVGSRSPCVLRT